MWQMTFPDDIEGLVVLNEEQAKYICWEYCQNDDDDKTGCFCDNCPLGQVEIYALEAKLEQLKKQKRGFTHEEALFVSAMIGSSF